MNRYRSWSLIIVCSLLFLMAGASTRGQGSGRERGPEFVDGREVVPGEVLIRFRGADNRIERGALGTQLDLDTDEEVGGVNVRRMRSRLFDTNALMGFFRSHPDVEFVEPNYVLRVAAVPNDPKFPQLWGLQNPTIPNADIHATAAWDVSTGNRNAVIGVVDTGIDYTHPDLADNVWSAPADFDLTIGGVAVHCLRGSHGFNAITKSCNPMDDNNHGTHVSGTIGAVGNNGAGVAGVNWTTQIM